MGIDSPQSTGNDVLTHLTNYKSQALNFDNIWGALNMPRITSYLWAGNNSAKWFERSALQRKSSNATSYKKNLVWNSPPH